MTIDEHKSTEISAPAITGVEALRIAAVLGFPSVAAGVIARRRWTMGLLEKLQADRSTLSTIRSLRDRFGTGPVQLVLPGRRLAVVLAEDDVARVLDESPEPFTPANKEKRGALSGFQPHGVLISRGKIRSARRTVNEAALDTHRPLHHLAGTFTEVVTDEFTREVDRASHAGTMDAADFTVRWWQVVRRVTLGDNARDDSEITDSLWTLRSKGNWSYFVPTPRRDRDRFAEGLYNYVEDAEEGSLAHALTEVPASGAVDPVGQIPHWLFAFDAAGIVCSRALALLATHPEKLERALEEIDAAELDEPQLYSYLRACVLESVRLWPTTPAILRDSTGTTTWGEPGKRFSVPEGTAFLILAAAFHRDRNTLDYADRFEPEVWLDGRAEMTPQLVPFSAGPAGCPGQNLVLHITTTTLATLLKRARWELTSTPKLTPGEPLPTTLNNFGLEFSIRDRSDV
jgi:Cytochrome P450